MHEEDFKAGLLVPMFMTGQGLFVYLIKCSMREGHTDQEQVGTLLRVFSIVLKNEEAVHVTRRVVFKVKCIHEVNSYPSVVTKL